MGIDERSETCFEQFITDTEGGLSFQINAMSLKELEEKVNEILMILNKSE